MGLPRLAQVSPFALLVTAAGLAVGVIVPITTLPRLPTFSPWPVAAGLTVWTTGKYVLCPLRWYAISVSQRPLRWHLAVYAQSQLLGLVTPGQLGGDLWRVHRLSTADGDSAALTRLTAATEIATDKLIAAVGVAVLALSAAATLPRTAALTVVALTVVALTVVAALSATVICRARPRWWPPYRLPRLRHAAAGVVLSVVDQLTTLTLLIATLKATGHEIDALAAFTAFGPSQLAGIVPGPPGASPRDGALVLALVTLGVPWTAALGAVTLTAMLAFLPGLLLGGGGLLLAHLPRREPDSSAPAHDACLHPQEHVTPDDA